MQKLDNILFVFAGSDDTRQIKTRRISDNVYTFDLDDGASGVIAFNPTDDQMLALEDDTQPIPSLSDMERRLELVESAIQTTSNRMDAVEARLHSFALAIAKIANQFKKVVFMLGDVTTLEDVADAVFGTPDKPVTPEDEMKKGA